MHLFGEKNYAGIIGTFTTIIFFTEIQVVRVIDLVYKHLEVLTFGSTGLNLFEILYYSVNIDRVTWLMLLV